MYYTNVKSWLAQAVKDGSLSVDTLLSLCLSHLDESDIRDYFSQNLAALDLDNHGENDPQARIPCWEQDTATAFYTQCCWLRKSDFDYDWREDHNTYPRDTITIEPESPAHYTYTLRNRPAGYGTCPDGRLVALDMPPVHNEMNDDWGTITYTRPLTADEMYRYELDPASDNTFAFPVSSRVWVNDCELATVYAHLQRNRYYVQFDSNGTIGNVHATALAPVRE
jgi:hypothetical protein